MHTTVQKRGCDFLARESLFGGFLLLLLLFSLNLTPVGDKHLFLVNGEVGS